MSRIGKNPITIPAGAQITVSEGNLVTVKGPKGTLSQQVDSDLTLRQEDGTLILERPTEQKRHKAMHGLYRSLVQNMVEGVTNGYTKKLELVGVGFKAEMQGTNLNLALGFSHNVLVALPDEIKATTLTEKGKNPIITLESNDKQLIGQVAAKIRELRKVEPYKGKGVRFVGEIIRRKAGKTSAK
jgi:large subunit ribosomal protein L6